MEKRQIKPNVVLDSTKQQMKTIIKRKRSIQKINIIKIKYTVKILQP